MNICLFIYIYLCLLRIFNMGYMVSQDTSGEISQSKEDSGKTDCECEHVAKPC